MNFTIHQASHIGDRPYNQDRVAYAYSNDALLLVLADGMGGHLHGELAAAAAVETFVAEFCEHASAPLTNPAAFLADTMRMAHEHVMHLARPNQQGVPGTTCVAALIQNGMLYRGHAGDSRLYLLRDGAVLAKTRDHSVVHQWFEWGVITAEEARVHPQRNQITNCLGGAHHIFRMEPGDPVALRSGDVLLLGSDGLWGPFTDGELAEAFTARPVAETLDRLVAGALARDDGHADNITGLALRWGEEEPSHDTAVPVSHILEIP